MYLKILKCVFLSFPGDNGGRSSPPHRAAPPAAGPAGGHAPPPRSGQLLDPPARDLKAIDG